MTVEPSADQRSILSAQVVQSAPQCRWRQSAV